MADDSVVCYDDITTTLDKLPLESKCSCNSLFTSFLSHRVSIFKHLHSIYFSALSMHYVQRKTLQCASVVYYITDIRLSRMTLCPIVVCYNTDDSWRKCRLLHHGYKAVAVTLGPAAMLCTGFCTGSWQKMTKMSKRVKYCGPYIPYDLLQANGDTCAKFRWDRFRNMDLYKVQTNKEISKKEQKPISSLYIR